MPITIDVSDCEMLREPIDRARDKGRREGKAEAVVELLEHRFPGSVPVGLAAHLSDLNLDRLSLILLRSVTAPSVAHALGTHMPATEGSRP